MTTRLNVNVNDETVGALRSLAESQGTTVTEQIRRAVSVHAFFAEARAAGKRVRLVGADGGVTEVVWP